MWISSPGLSSVEELLVSTSLLSSSLPEKMKPKRVLDGTTRSDWLPHCMEALIEASDVDHLDFLAAKDYTHEYVDTERRLHHWYMLIHGSDLNLVITSVRRLVEWCRDNPEDASNITDYVAADDLVQCIDNAFYTLSPNLEAPGEDEGRGPEFLFCTLRTIEELLKFAKSRDLIVVYDNNSYIY
jgi:hypothetical protein